MIKPQAGALLIADPFLKDTNFSRAVVFLCEHRMDGSFGLVINKPLDMVLDEVIDGITEKDIKIFYGGPVELDTIHFLHQLPDLIPGSVRVSTDIYWGGDFDLVIQLINNKEIDLTKIRFFLGYSGWQEGQLNAEIVETKSWLTVMANRKLIFHKNLENIWGDALTTLGNQYALLKHYPIDPQLN
jgi:putative transcriptional regulator